MILFLIWEIGVVQRFGLLDLRVVQGFGLLEEVRSGVPR